jgi:hypothetical protein
VADRTRDLGKQPDPAEPQGVGEAGWGNFILLQQPYLTWIFRDKVIRILRAHDEADKNEGGPKRRKVARYASDAVAPGSALGQRLLDLDPNADLGYVDETACASREEVLAGLNLVTRLVDYKFLLLDPPDMLTSP